MRSLGNENDFFHLWLWVCLYTAFVGSSISWWRLWKKRWLNFLTLEWVVIVVGGCDDRRKAGFNFGFEVGGGGQMDTQDTLMKLCWQLLSVKSVMYLIAMNVSLWANYVGDICAIVSCNWRKGWFSSGHTVENEGQGFFFYMGVYTSVCQKWHIFWLANSFQITTKSKKWIEPGT